MKDNQSLNRTRLGLQYNVSAPVGQNLREKGDPVGGRIASEGCALGDGESAGVAQKPTGAFDDNPQMEISCAYHC